MRNRPALKPGSWLHWPRCSWLHAGAAARMRGGAPGGCVSMRCTFSTTKPFQTQVCPPMADLQTHFQLLCAFLQNGVYLLLCYSSRRLPALGMPACYIPMKRPHWPQTPAICLSAVTQNCLRRSARAAASCRGRVRAALPAAARAQTECRARCQSSSRGDRGSSFESRGGRPASAEAAALE